MYYKAKTGIISILNMGYTKTTILGVSWMSFFRIITRILSFLKIAVLARILTPAQFGVFGIGFLVLTFLEIFLETGINIILIQTKKEIDNYIDSAWVVSIIRGILMSILIIIFSPFIANYFNTPQALGILLFISVIPLVRGFINPAEVKFKKDLKFKYEFWFRSAIFLVDSVVTILALIITHSIYSLVLGLLAGAITEVVLSFVLVKPVPKFKIRSGYFKEIVNKGKWITAYGIFNYLGENGDNLVVGKILGSTSLGFYQMAYKLSILPISEVSDVVSQVVFPIYTKIENDTKRLTRAFLKTTGIISMGSLLVGGVIYFFPVEIITVILGNQWVSAAPVLKILSLYGIFRAISGPASALFLAKGKQNYVTYMVFVRFAVLAITIYPLIMMFGLIGAGYSALLSVLAEIPVITYFIFRIYNSND
jgi:lipopolysaccharide exporter